MDERTFAARAREIHNGELNITDFVKDLEKQLASPCSIESMINNYKGLFTYQRGPKGFHRWGGLKYFLMEYEEYLKVNKFRETDDHINWNNFYELTIEHILPQSFWENWSSVMNDYLAVRNVPDESIEQANKIIINTLGNLTILKYKKNSALQNDSWELKRKRYKSGSFNEIEVSENEKWDKDTIEARGKKMLDFMKTKIAGLSFTPEQVDELLFMSEQYYVYPRTQSEESSE